jgi:hypothetical protein
MFSLYCRFSAFRRFAVFLALLAMLAPLGVGIVHHPQAMAMPMRMDMPMSASMSMPMPGMRQKADSGHAEKVPHKMPPCPICQTLHMLAAGFITPDLPVFATPDFPSVAFSLSDSAFDLWPAHITPAQPRAPPLSV